MTDLTTTLNVIREHSPCEGGWAKLLRPLGKTKADDDPLPLLTIAKSNGVDDALWCLRAIPDAETHPTILNFRADCAARALHLFERERPDDMRVRGAIQATRDFAAGTVTREQWNIVQPAAFALFRAAAWDATWTVARDIALSAARDIAWDIAWRDACATAWAAAREWQTARLIGWLDGTVTEPYPMPERKQA